MLSMLCHFRSLLCGFAYAGSAHFCVSVRTGHSQREVNVLHLPSYAVR